MIDYTLVVGVDRTHLRQLGYVWPTWKRHKPSILQHPMVVFFDRESVNRQTVEDLIDHPDLCVIEWPYQRIEYSEGLGDKWSNPQRHKMLAGFVHVPATVVTTPYWLKLDTDTVATGIPDWIESDWFQDGVAIAAHPWGYTKPANQMLDLDRWVDDNREELSIFRLSKSLRLTPNEGSDLVRHERIISWCGFFSTAVTRLCSKMAKATCGEGKLPVPSQDGYVWYVCERLGLTVLRVNMKKRGWEWWSSEKNVKEASRRALL